jgi:hypothetical protein
MVKLKSGREVELKPLTIRQKFELRSRALEAYEKKGISFDPMFSLDLVTMCTDLTDDQLDKDGWTVADVDECASLILKDSQLADTDKKK